MIPNYSAALLISMKSYIVAIHENLITWQTRKQMQTNKSTPYSKPKKTPYDGVFMVLRFVTNIWHMEIKFMPWNLVSQACGEGN